MHPCLAALYDIEAAIRGKSAAERRAARQVRSKPLIEALKLWFEERAVELPRKSPLAEAIGYALNQWDGRARFLDDGRIEIDSNTVERSMRPIALNRKNALFAGHDLGAENWAALASLIETCKLHGVNPEAWLADVLARLVDKLPQHGAVRVSRHVKVKGQTSPFDPSLRHYWEVGRIAASPNSPPGLGKPPEAAPTGLRREHHAPKRRDRTPKNQATENRVGPKHRLR